MIVGALMVLGIGASIGLVGRFAVPGRHGLLRMMYRDPKLVPQLLRRDDEVWWEVGGGALGSFLGYVVGYWYDSYSLTGTTPIRWYLAVIGALVLIGIAVVSGIIERSRWTRRLGVHQWRARGVTQ